MRKLFLMIVVAALLVSPAEADGGKRRNLPQERQMLAAKRFDLTLLKDRAHLKRFIKVGLLIRIHDRTGVYHLETVGELDPNHRDLYAYARTYVKSFLDAELGDLASRYGGDYKVISLVRTKAYQKLVCKAYGGTAICGRLWWQQSSHLTGATVDISFDGMSRKAKAAFGKRLRKLQSQDKVIFITESGCYHVMVMPTYDKAKKAKKPAKAKTKRRPSGKAKRRSRTR